MSIKFPSQLTEFINIDELVLDKLNAKIHTEPDLEKLARIIETEGFNDPITIGTVKNEDPIVICGNGRVQAMKMLGATQIPFVKKDFRTEASRNSYGLKHNAVGLETGFDALKYQKNIELIATDEVELAEFETYEFKALEVGKIEKLNNVLNNVELIDNIGEQKELKNTNEEIDKIDDVDNIADKTKDEAKFITFGDVIHLGRHKLMCGDSFDDNYVDKLINNTIIDCVFTDPPYGMKLDTDFSEISKASNSNKKCQSKIYKKVEGDDVPFDPSYIINKFNNIKEVFLWGANYFADKLPKLAGGGVILVCLG